MIPYTELIKTFEYQFDVAQNELFWQVKSYMETNNLSELQVATNLKISLKLVKQILKGNANPKLSELISIQCYGNNPN